MPTIKDIAQLAGVSQGTVSNVLNGKGIVSSNKIKLVQNAAAALGYTVNERAKILRKGKGKILAVILPNIRVRNHVDFYLSFKSHAESQGFRVLQYISNDSPETELQALVQIRSEMVSGLAVFSCLGTGTSAYRDAGFADHEILFVERDPRVPCNFIGFDHALCGMELAKLAIAKGHRNVAVITDNTDFSNEADFLDSFRKTLESRPGFTATHIHTDLFRKNQSAIQIFAAGTPEGIFCSNHDFAQTIKDVGDNFYPSARTSIHTISPVFTMPESSYTKYELNYRLMGQASAKFLVANQDSQKTGQHTILHNTGFRNWSCSIPSISTGIPSMTSSRKAPAKGPGTDSKEGSGTRLKLLTLESPAAEAMRSLSLIYSHATGVKVEVSVFPYHEMHKVFETMEQSSPYDVVRLDVTWLSWYANKILQPLMEIDPTIISILDTFVDGIERKYSHVGDTLFALPESPSNQLLFYRKDLFESTVLKRLYHEEYKSRLAPPRDFTEYNRIARFFTKDFSPHSPVDFGSTVTLGSEGVAATEFLTRYLSSTDTLFNPDGHILLTSHHAIKALSELVELKQYSKPEPSDWWTSAAREFAQGDVAMTILYSNFASGILSKESRVINKIGYAVVPGNNSVIGGGTLGVSRFSRQPELALSFVRWVCSEPISSALSLLGSVPACKQSFDNYEIVDTYPWLDLSRKCFSRSHYQRTPFNGTRPFDEHRFLGILGSAVKSAYNGTASPQEALRKAQEQYEAIEPELLGSARS
jgi:multiple sugar transport system substrate-binding protein